MTKVREQLSPALVISVIALFVALGGGAYAALSANSVGTKQLKRNAVTTAKIRNGAVNVNKIKAGAVIAGKVKAGAIGTGKIANGAVTEPKIADGAVTESKLSDGILGSAVAYARVNGDGSVDEAHSRGITDINVVIEGTSTYCLAGLPDHGSYAVTPGMGLTEFDGITSVNVDQAPFLEGVCGSVPGAQIGVVTYYDDFAVAGNPIRSKKPFTIVLLK